MQELINRIIQINQIADQKVKQAESEQQKAFNHLETEKVDVSDEIQSRATNRLGNFEAVSYTHLGTHKIVPLKPDPSTDGRVKFPSLPVLSDPYP